MYQNVEKKVMWKVGTKVHISSFQKKKMFNKLIVAIQRDVGEYFQVTKHTLVCSRHFKWDDFKLSFAKRKRDLKTMALPSVFVWRKESPVKRKSLMKRFISCQAEKGGKNNEKQKDNCVC